MQMPLYGVRGITEYLDKYKQYVIHILWLLESLN